MDELEDTRANRRKLKKYGQYGMDWYKFKDGVPPQDDDIDYYWNGHMWLVCGEGQEI